MFDRAFADPFIIAEIGVNHEGSIDRAKRMIEAAARAGPHAAKFQTYKAETLASEGNSPAYWDTSKEPTASQFELFSRFDSFGKDEYLELAGHCHDVGVEFMSTPFDLDSVDELAPMMPAIKIASADLTNVPLLRKVAGKAMPVILSVGASTHDEISWALDILERAGATEVALLHCVLRYPTPVDNANVLGVRKLHDLFGDRASIGYSDHVAPTAEGEAPSAELASLLGATIIEKHFTDDRSGSGNDHYHAFDESAMSNFVARLRLFRSLAGDGVPDIQAQLAAVTNARRRIFAIHEIAAGATISGSDLIALRADSGLEVARWDEVIGAVATSDIEKGRPVLSTDFRRVDR